MLSGDKARTLRPSKRLSPVRPGDPRIAQRLSKALEGEVLFDAFSRGRYATDASIYQIEPVGVVVPKTAADVRAAFEIAKDEGMPLLPRGGGSSQCGQTVGEALVFDTTKHLNKIVDFDPDARKVTVEPGIVLDHLNAFLRPHGLWFPVDVSTSSRATIGGMTANNSCGSRSLRYGNMVHNVGAIDALLADGRRMRFGEVSGNFASIGQDPDYAAIVGDVGALAERMAGEIAERIPKVQRKVGGYNLEMVPRLKPDGSFEPAPPLNGFGADYPWGSRVGANMAHLLVGSEGTLAYFEAIELHLEPLPKNKVLGICHFPTFYAAMENTQHLVALRPTAVELVDRTLLGLAREIAMYRPIIERHVKGAPDALLLVEFAEADKAESLRKLKELVGLMDDLGFPGGVVEVTEPKQQTDVWNVRKACLNIAMSMKGDAKPVSFIEDCAVRLEDLAEYTDRLTRIFHQYGTEGTWYAHASVGTLHVRPILNLKSPVGIHALRAIAEEAFAMVQEYRGAHSGEHGDGIVRSEFHEPMYGSALVRAFEEVKDRLDPDDRMNPGKVVRPYRMDDPRYFRYPPNYAPQPIEPVLDWSGWGGFLGAVEMCNNNGTCRKANPGVMCPSFRATNDEQHLTRGRANALRLAITGQLGPKAFTSPDMKAAMDLCVGCKGCKRECPTGVDMAKMKIEFQHHYHKEHGLPLKERLVAYLPHYAQLAAKAPWAMDLRERVPLAAKLMEAATGISAERALPKFVKAPFGPKTAKHRQRSGRANGHAGAEVVLFADTFNTYYEPENLQAALSVLEAAGYTVHLPGPAKGTRPLCCGRTFLSAGLVAEARAEMTRTLEALEPYLARGVPVVGLEPSCLLTFRDEVLAVLPGDRAKRIAEAALTFEEFLARELKSGRLELPLRSLGARKILLHGHCHQKAFAAVDPILDILALIPDASPELIESSCCGMAGAFGYDARHYEVSLKMGELSLLPAVRGASEDTIIAADGTSCRHQIADGAGRTAEHVARILERALDPAVAV